MVLFAVAQGLSKSQSIVKKAETPQT